MLLGKRLVRASRILLACLLWPGQAVPGDLFVSDEVVVRTYDVEGATLREVREDMKRKGPKGRWGHAKSNWKWDRYCNMQFRAVVTMPQLVSRARLSRRELDVWDRMEKQLLAHEMEHVEIGRQWASAIKQAGCIRRRVTEIGARFHDADAELDRRTDHGRLTGVHLDP